MSYDTHCSSCGMPYSDFAREGAKSCECHKMAAQAVRDFVFDKPALSAAPVAQEPVARDNERFKRFSNDEVATIPDGYRSPLSIKTSTELIAEQEARAVTPPATPAGTPANRGDRVIYWLKRYQADEHLDDDACEELDALINVLSKGVKVQPSAGVGADEIARAISAPLWLRPVDGDTYEIAGIDVATNAILALLSRAGDQSNSTHEEQSKQNI